MGMSVNTNMAALSALQQINHTTQELDETQLRVNSGLAVRGAKDNAAVYAIAQNLRADRRGLDAVTDSLNRSISVLDITISAAESVQNTLMEMKSKVVAAADKGLTQASRDALKKDFERLREQLVVMVKHATFNGSNLIDGASGSPPKLSAILNSNASVTIDVPRVNLQLAPAGTSSFTAPTLQADGTYAGNFVHLAVDSTFNTAAEAETLIARIDASIDNLSQAQTVFGSASRSMDLQRTYTNKLSDTLEGGIGNLVDANMARESAKLKALQVKMQLGTQALSIANSNPEQILSLFGR